MITVAENEPASRLDLISDELWQPRVALLEALEKK